MAKGGEHVDVERGLALTCQHFFGEGSPLLSVGRFRLIRSLGRGSQGSVYEALDPLGHRTVALKVLHGAGPATRDAIQREFRALADLTHPNIVRVHELFVERHVAYFTMELVEGSDFLTYATACDLDALCDALSQLRQALSALHAAGKLHRDLKPDNVLVKPTGHLVLLDFGMVTDRQRTGHACESGDLDHLGLLLLAALRARHAAGRLDAHELERLALQLMAAGPATRTKP